MTGTGKRRWQGVRFVIILLHQASDRLTRQDFFERKNLYDSLVMKPSPLRLDFESSKHAEPITKPTK